MIPNGSYAGMDVYTNDGEKVGRVKGPPRAAGLPGFQYLVIDRQRQRDIAVPSSVPGISGDHLVLPFGMSVVESAPHVPLGARAMSLEETVLLDSFYSLWTKGAGGGRRGAIPQIYKQHD
jgi:hypothetical protein